MIEDDKAAFAEAMTTTALAFDIELSQERIQLYWLMLAPYSIEAVRAAFGRTIKALKWFPRVADMVEAIEGGAELNAVFAWEKVRAALKYPSPYQTVAFDDPTIHRTLECLDGWAGAYHWPDDLTWIKKEFVRVYQLMHGKVEDAPTCLPGRGQIEADRKGNPWRGKVWYLGDADKARALYETRTKLLTGGMHGKEKG